MAKKGLYITPQGVSPQCSGLEIKESQTEKQKKEEKGLRGHFVPSRGFFKTFGEALGAAEVQHSLQRYKLRLFRFGLIV